MKNASNKSTFSPVRMETKDLIALAAALAGVRRNAGQEPESSKPQHQRATAATLSDIATWGG
ncbi:MAG: hypothetical protein IT166_13220 [Bryobacterales bacterium]|nr:hypothetical protein [Bryobacterales bacterium]